MAYVAPLSHACYFEAGAHPYVLGVDNPDDSLPPILPHVEDFGDWRTWVGRWGNSTGVGGGTFGGRSPASPGKQGQKWDNPNAWHTRGLAKKPLRVGSQAVRQAGRATYPKLQSIDAERDDGRVRVAYELDPATPAQGLLPARHAPQARRRAPAARQLARSRSARRRAWSKCRSRRA